MVVGITFKQNLGRSRKPTAALGRADQGDEHARIEQAGTMEEFEGRDGLRCFFVGTAGKHNLTEGAKLELGMIVGKVDGIVHLLTAHNAHRRRGDIGQLQGGDRLNGTCVHTIWTNEQNGLVWCNLKRGYHKAATTIQFCTRSQLHRFPFRLQNPCHLRLMRQPVYSKSWHYLLEVIT